MKCAIALAGNPNCGKTTLFNALTGTNQFVGNWPGVTVEKKEGGLKKDKAVSVVDLPGIYSLSPYSPEEVVARDYLVDQRPDVILNIVDATNLERNLYLTTQLLELGIPVVVALNMADLVKAKGDRIDVEGLARKLSCEVVQISALKGEGIEQAVQAALVAAGTSASAEEGMFSDTVERALASIEQTALSDKTDLRRWYAVKLFERDCKVAEGLALDAATSQSVEDTIAAVEQELDDDAASIIVSERYAFIGKVVSACLKKAPEKDASVSEKIDRVVTNRWLGLPIFALVMFIVYYIAMGTIGAAATDWTNDNLFGDGFHLTGGAAYEEDAEAFAQASAIVEGFDTYVSENGHAPSASFEYAVTDDETLEVSEETASYSDYLQATAIVAEYGSEGPDPADYGVWVPGIPRLIEAALDVLNCADWLKGLVLDGIVAGVGAVLGFVPQMLVLFFLLALLEGCGYMARIAFVLDRVFRKFGLSGKSFIPMLVGTGCGVPGVMASRAIENERDRRMTVMTTTFIPCGAKIPFIAMIAGAIFNGSAWVATSAYFIGMAAIIASGIILKKTRMFAGEPAPFVMELPAYHLPTMGNSLRSMWERGWSFIKKAGTIILLSTIFIWFTSFFGFTDEGFRMLEEDELSLSLLAQIGSALAWIFAPLGWGNWQATVASITGLVAKENIVGTMGILYGAEGNAWQTLASVFTPVTGFSFLVFNLLCAPCFAAIGAIKREMNSRKWTTFAISYQCCFAYVVALMIAQFGGALTGDMNVFGLIAAFVCLAALVYLLVRPARQVSTK